MTCGLAPRLLNFWPQAQSFTPPPCRAPASPRNAPQAKGCAGLRLAGHPLANFPQPVPPCTTTEIMNYRNGLTALLRRSFGALACVLLAVFASAQTAPAA